VTFPIRLVLDTSAILAYTAGSIAVGETITEVVDEGARFALPIVCLAEACRRCGDDHQAAVHLLANHLSAAVTGIPEDDWWLLALSVGTGARDEATCNVLLAMEVEETPGVVSIPLEQGIEIARLLTSVVVSLDRVGSRMAGGDADVHTLEQFMSEWLVAPRLSRASGVLWDAIAQVIGEDTVEEIAESVPVFPGPVPEEVRTLKKELRRVDEFGR
jgi:hypothetical protein